MIRYEYFLSREKGRIIPKINTLHTKQNYIVATILKILLLILIRITNQHCILVYVVSLHCNVLVLV